MSFWVIFDVSQLIDYYADVHNLIAMPIGATIRYDYRRKYLSDTAIELAEAPRARFLWTIPTEARWRKNVLLLYEQKNCPYKRTETESKPANLSSEPVVVATRLGEILNIVRDGDHYYFDIQVGKYPAQTPADLNGILEGLGASRPWAEDEGGFAAGKFVSVSNADAAYNQLVITDEHKGWQNVVNKLSGGAMQFSGDVFWRLSGPYKRAGKSVYKPHIEKHRESGVVRRADAVYKIHRGTTWRFELASDVGRHVAGRPQYEAEITSSDNSALKLSGTSKFSLRRNTTQIVQFRAESAERFMAATADLLFTTISKAGGWPNGPSFKLQFKTHENRIRFCLGLICLVIGATGVITGKSDVMKNHQGWALGIEILGWLFGLLAGSLLIRKVSLPGS
jgi:hypothetical protein